MDYEVEYLKLENERLRNQLENEKNNKDIPSDVMVQINQLVSIASEMKNLLLDIRNTQIHVSLARRIDDIIRKTEQFD